MIKAALFDVGGVLLNGYIRVFLTELAKELNLEAEQLIALRKEYHLKMIVNEMSIEDMISIMRRKYDMKLTEPEIIAIWKQKYVQCMPVNTELIDFIRQLKCKTGIISDVYALHAGINRSRGIYSGFDPCVLSYEIGCKKPDSRIFQAALQRLGLKAEECVFVDDAEKNVKAAEALGFKAVLHTDNETTITAMKKMGL
jgi:epoxide hydrolase-like predicted phosphatase